MSKPMSCIYINLPYYGAYRITQFGVRVCVLNPHIAYRFVSVWKYFPMKSFSLFFTVLHNWYASGYLMTQVYVRMAGKTFFLYLFALIMCITIRWRVDFEFVIMIYRLNYVKTNFNFNLKFCVPKHTDQLW